MFKPKLLPLLVSQRDSEGWSLEAENGESSLKFSSEMFQVHFFSGSHRWQVLYHAEYPVSLILSHQKAPQVIVSGEKGLKVYMEVLLLIQMSMSDNKT